MFYGQHHEDVFIKTIFPNTNNGVCIEVGASDGISGSNTKHFEDIGWKSLCIEPISSNFEKCKTIRKDCYQCCISDKDKEDTEFTIFHLNENLSAISSLEPDHRLIESHSHLITDTTKIKVKVRSLNSLLEELQFPKNIDFISIDTENTELDVLKGIDLNVYNVTLLVVENNYDEPFCEDYLSQYGYKKIKRIAVNDFYLKQEKYIHYHGENKMKVEVSIGEAIDKLSILEIKLIKISDKNKKIKVQKEINCLQECVIYKTKYEYYYNLLMYVNNKIWNLTDVIKKIASSDPQFANISKQIFEFNQQRFRIKNWFNLLTGSNINEQKSYELSHCKIVIESEDIFFNKLPEIYFLALEYDVITFDTSDILDISIISNCLKIPTIIYDNEQKKLLCNPTVIIISNFYILENELKAAFSLKPITYIVGGLLGDFIQSLSVICETYYQTGRKGILYISERGHGFRNGLENTYNEIYQSIIGQKYIQDFKIYNNEPFEIDLSEWRSSPLLFHQNWHHIYKQIYNVEWGKRPWLIASYDEKWKDKIVINTTNYRWPINIEFKKLNELYPNEMVFISFDREQYNFFERTTSISIEYYEPKSFLEMVTIINSCKLFVGSLSSPLSIANALHKDRICGLCSSIADNNHNLHLENVFPNIRYSV